jgi:hypothetical protein
MAKKKTKMSEDKEELRRNPINEFTCCDKTMVFEEFKEHLSSVHKLTPDQFKGNKQMVCHMDGDYWFSSSYKWKLETGLEFSQYVRLARDKDTMLY